MDFDEQKSYNGNKIPYFSQIPLYNPLYNKNYLFQPGYSQPPINNQQSGFQQLGYGQKSIDDQQSDYFPQPGYGENSGYSPQPDYGKNSGVYPQPGYDKNSGYYPQPRHGKISGYSPQPRHGKKSINELQLDNSPQQKSYIQKIAYDPLSKYGQQSNYTQQNLIYKEGFIQQQIGDSCHEHGLHFQDSLKEKCHICGKTNPKNSGYKCKECFIALCSDSFYKIFYGEKKRSLHPHSLALKYKENYK